MPTDTYWPADIAVCGGKGCDKRRSCSRYVWSSRDRDPLRQVWMAPPETVKNGVCDLYVPEVIGG